MRDHEMERIRGTLRALPVLAPPLSLRAKLRALASRELGRRRQRDAVRGWLARRAEMCLLSMNNLMRPVALPLAGGLASAVILFSAMLPGVTVNRFPHSDVPTALATEATLQTSFSFPLDDEEVVVEVVIDETGGVIDYSIPKDQRWFADPILRKSVENALVFMRFSPRTLFGQPFGGKTRIKFRRSHLDVKG